jgi:light-regulated signal transduction histidine kinase (bacteriophytochrome)
MVFLITYELSQRALAEGRIDKLRVEIADALTSAEDATAALLGVSHAIRGLVSSDGLSVVVGQRVVCFPPSLDRMAAIQVAEHLTRLQPHSLITDAISRDAPALHALLGDKSASAGVLAIQINVDPAITLIWWRSELVETVAWAGQPEKSTIETAKGLQLGPRKSFALWKETVRGKSESWDATDRFAGRELKAILQDVALDNLRAVEHEHAALLAIMGHDLRDPLQAIDLVVTLMGQGLVSSGDGVKRIEYSSRRMQSLIAYILDISRLRAGIGLGLNAKPTALGELLRVTLAQAQLNFPGVQMTSTIEHIGTSHVDSDRIVQALTNLLSNARHHGDMRHPITVTAAHDDGASRIQIKNHIHAGKMFHPGAMTKPFHAASTTNVLNQGGLGLGLYIANAIVIGHGGTLECECTEQHAIFTVVLNATPISTPLGGEK